MELFYYVKWSNVMFWKLVVDFEGNNGAKWRVFLSSFCAWFLSFVCFWRSHTSFEHLLLHQLGLLGFFCSMNPLQDPSSRALIRAAQDLPGPSYFFEREQRKEASLCPFLCYPKQWENVEKVGHNLSGRFCWACRARTSYKCSKCLGTGVSFQSWMHWSKGGSCLLRNSVWYCVVGYSMVAKLSLTGPEATSLVTWSFDYILTPPWDITSSHCPGFHAERSSVCSSCGFAPLTLQPSSLGLVFAPAPADSDIVSMGRGSVLAVSQYSSPVFLKKFLWAVHIKGFQKRIGLDKTLLSRLFPYFSALSLPSIAQSVLSVLSCTLCSLDIMLAGLFLSWAMTECVLVIRVRL